jgi:hypothetical protein
VVFKRVRKNCEERLLASSCLPARRFAQNSASNGQIIMKFDIWAFFEKCRVCTGFINIWQEWEKKRVVYMQTNRQFWSYLAKFFLEWKMFQTKVVEKIKTHILSSITFFRKSCRLWDNVKNIVLRSRSRQYGACALHAGYLGLQTHTHKHTLRICYSYCFSAATMVYERASVLRYACTARLVQLNFTRCLGSLASQQKVYTRTYDI